MGSDVLERNLNVLKMLVQQYGLEKTKAYIDLYLTLDDEWLRDNGYPISVLPRRVNGLIVQSAESRMGADGKLLENVCGYAESGTPIVTDNDRPLVKGFVVVKYQDWLKLTIDQRFNLQPGGKRRGEWVDNWFLNYDKPDFCLDDYPYLINLLKKYGAHKIAKHYEAFYKLRKAGMAPQKAWKQFIGDRPLVRDVNEII